MILDGGLLFLGHPVVRGLD